MDLKDLLDSGNPEKVNKYFDSMPNEQWPEIEAAMEKLVPNQLSVLVECLRVAKSTRLHKPRYLECRQRPKDLWRRAARAEP